MLQSLVKLGRLFPIKTAFVTASNLKIIILLGIAYILYLWTSSSFRIITSNYSCPHCPPVKNSYNKITPTEKVTIKEVKEFRNINLRLVGLAESIGEMDFLLNIRKLIVFAVHELNEPLKYTNCTKWWANPLEMVFHQERPILKNYTEHLITFLVHPGNFKCQVTIRQQKAPINLGDQELEIRSPFGMDKQFQSEPWNGDRSIIDDAKKTCLCSSNPKLQEYSKTTNELRTRWNYTDTELITWHPDKSFYIPDYMNFTDYDWFIHSPGNSTLEINEVGYSTEFCGPDIKMLVMVSSAPNHFKHRKIIRETYASHSNLKGKGIKVVFLMGIPEDAAINEQVKLEAEMSKDIIQANYVDSYHNLTISHLSMYKWAHLTCIGGKDKEVTVPQFILKADDDFLLNIDLALEVALKNSEFEFIGRLFCSTKVMRSVTLMRKYYTPRYMHISGTYAGYLSGVTYLMRTDIIPRLLHMAKTTPMIHMDDAYVSGILLRQLNIYPRESQLFTYLRIVPDACRSKKMINSFVLNPDDMAVQWLKFVEPMPLNCTLKDVVTIVTDLDFWTISNCLFTL